MDRGRAAGALDIALLCVGPARSQPPPVRIGVVIDGPWQRNTDVEVGSDRRRRSVPNHGPGDRNRDASDAARVLALRGEEMTRIMTKRRDQLSAYATVYYEHLAIRGYNWKTTTASGADVPMELLGRKIRSFGLGPEVALLQGRLWIRSLWEFGVRNNLEGFVVVRSLTFPF